MLQTESTTVGLSELLRLKQTPDDVQDPEDYNDVKV
jgi:hypothetical protein